MIIIPNAYSQQEDTLSEVVSIYRDPTLWRDTRSDLSIQWVIGYRL